MLDLSTEFGRRAAERLANETVIWLTTVRADGQPQSVPVWFLWDGQTLLIYTRPNTQKLRNMARHPRVGLHFNTDERGDDVVRIEGTAQVLPDFPPATQVPEMIDKYRAGIARIGMDPESFAHVYSVAIRVTPERVRGW